MDYDECIYNRVEMTIPRKDARYQEFGRDVLRLIQKYPDLLIGYDAEIILDDILDDDESWNVLKSELFKGYPYSECGERDGYLCYDARPDEAQKCIEDVYGVAQQAPSR